MVDNLRRKEIILPIGLGIIFSLLYYKLSLKYFVFLFVGLIFALLVLHDIKLGIFLGPLILPFMPDILNLLYIIFLFFAYIYKGIFKEINPLTKNSIDMPIVLFLIAITISTITSVEPKGSFRDFAIHLVAISYVFVVINSIKDKKDLNILMTIIVIASTLVAVYGLYQYKIGVDMEAKWLDTTNNSGIKTRVFSVFGNPNILAEYLIMITPISIALFWYNKKFHKKVIFLLSSLILIVSLLLTYSRGGWLGFAFGMFVFVFLVEKRLLLLLIPISIGLIYLLPPTIVNRILSIGNLGDSSNAYRIKIWKITLQIIKDYWLVGVGFGHLPFKATFDRYIRTMPIYHAHNTYLEVMAEMGILGLIVFIIFIFTLYKYSIKNIVKGEDRYFRTMTAGVLAGISALLVHGVVENVLYLTKIIITFWTLVAFLLVIMRIAKENGEIS